MAAGTGVLPSQAIAELLADGSIATPEPLLPDQLQPASLDLRLGAVAWRVRASFLPGQNATVQQRIEQLDGYAIDLSEGAVLERGCVYVVPLLEGLALAPDLAAFANPKSTTGRLDILTRVIADRGFVFDQVPAGYRGPLYAEITPRTFSVVVRPGDRLTQLRLRRGQPALAEAEVAKLLAEGALVGGPNEALAPTDRDKGVAVSVDLAGEGLATGGGPDALIGWRARKHTDRIDLRRLAHYDPLDFWEPLRAARHGSLVLDPNDFYILATREAVRVPPGLAAEMVAYDTAVGEFRVHYAGFFDPGFGWGEGAESRAVLEVRSHEVPFMLEHGQTIGWLRYERMASIPDRLYGQGLKSNYQGQGLMLAKQFRRP